MSQQENRLTLIEIVGKNKNNNKIGLYRCVCGNQKEIVCSSVNNNNTRSCGCLSREKSSIRLKEKETTHGLSKTSEYKTWSNLKDRCYNQNNKHYDRYGGRGIGVCKRWLDSFENFFYDMGKKPSKKHSIERKDNNGDYSPENCVWATPKTQCNNRRNNVFLEFNGQKLTVSQWAVKINVNPQLILGRINRGWSIEKILTSPRKVAKYKFLNEEHTLFEWSKIYNIDYSALRSRVLKLNWSIGPALNIPSKIGNNQWT